MRKGNILISGLAGVLAACSASVGLSADAGIYAPGPDGGKVVGKMAIINTLQEKNIAIEEFTTMSLENLLKYRVIIIPNTRALAQKEDPRWRDNLRAYVTECGGGIIFCHDAIGAARSPFGQVPLFPEIVVPNSVERHAVSEARVVLPSGTEETDMDFDYLPGYKHGQTVNHMYSDHFMFEQSGGTALLSAIEPEKTVVVFGKVGKGRVVFNGMIGAHPAGLAALLQGIDRDVMLNAVQWCLAGDGLAVSDAAAVRVAEWRPVIADETEQSGHKIAVIGDADYDIRHRARTKITWALPNYDYIPSHLMHLRDLSDYKLIIFFPPRNWEERKVPDTLFKQVADYIDSGGRIMIFMTSIGAKVEQYFLTPFGIRTLTTTDQNPDNLQSVRWSDASGHTLAINSLPPGKWFTTMTSPEAEGTKTVGYWHDGTGKLHSPAIIKTPFGYLLNVNIFDDHRLFTSVAAVELLPEIGSEVFAHLLQTHDTTREQIGGIEFSDQGRKLLDQAEKLRHSAEAAAQEGKFAAANLDILRSEDELVKAYAVSMPSVTGEVRMVTAHVHNLPDPEIICARLAKAGCTGVNVCGLEGHYPSRIYKRKNPEDNVDWMRKWIDTAHKHGLEFRVTIATFTIPETAKIYEQAVSEDWRVVTAGMYGKPSPALGRRRLDPCRSRPEVTDFAIAKAMELVEKYQVDYIYYDYIRWRDYCYCDFCRKKFQEDTGLKVEKWPDDVMDKYRAQYFDWRAEAVSRVVRQTSENIAGINAKTKLGVDTRPPRRAAFIEGQYWWEWGDYVDFITPMTYSPDNQHVLGAWAEIREAIPDGARARPTAGLPPPGSKGGTTLFRLQQIDLQRKYAPAGIIYFAYAGFSDGFFELLRIGPWRNR